MKTPNLDLMIEQLIVISHSRQLTISEELKLQEFRTIKRILNRVTK
jgi:hypothetical protein